jgi:hypothetical protein
MGVRKGLEGSDAFGGAVSASSFSTKLCSVPPGADVVVSFVASL